MREGAARRDRFSPAQSRAARGLLAWDAERLAQRAGLEAEAVELYEAGDGALGAAELAALVQALRDAGVIAIAERAAGEGVRLRFPSAPPTWPDRRGSPAKARCAANLVGDVATTLTAWPGARRRLV